VQVTVTYRDTGQQGLLLPGNVNRTAESKHGWPAWLMGRRAADENKLHWQTG